MIDTNKPMLVFQSDFTYKEGAVAAMYGVVKSVDRTLEILDATHELPQYDIWSASYRLMQYMHFYPKGTIFVSVVDPGVGTSRKACVALTNDGYTIVTPDNGTLTHIKATVGIKAVRQIDETINRLHGAGTDQISVFHGRDLFGYCAARLASGIIDYEHVGPLYDVDEVVTLPILESSLKTDYIDGIFEINDPNFGNLWTNIPLDLFLQAGFKYGQKVNVEVRYGQEMIFADAVVFVKTFGDAATGDILIYNNELNRIAMAISKGDLTTSKGLGCGNEWHVRFWRNHE